MPATRQERDPDPLRRWVRDLDPATRGRLTALAPGQPLPPDLAWSLVAAGVPVTPLGQGAYAPPEGLDQALAEPPPRVDLSRRRPPGAPRPP